MWPEKNDGSTRCASDATFRQRAGLADPAGVSYESPNYPGRHVRHWEYLLNVQAVSTPTGRADATFHTR
ncbi:AbfB domain-containing protein [Streptomyces massasporeus]|uniref:AbfB domain-containing protein n=1 Tax=Streptomyces massasporeus TaxID=67324 RepID=UPI0037F5B055